MLWKNQKRYTSPWSKAVTNHRELFKLAQKKTIAEMNDPERLAYWQALFEEQLDNPKQGEKQYVKLQCYIAAQLLRNGKKCRIR